MSHPPLLPTQRPLDDDELRAILAPLGIVAQHSLLSGGTFTAVQAATLGDGTEVVVKTSVPERALPDGRTPLLTYERDMLATERDMLRLLATTPDVPAPQLLLDDFTRSIAEVDTVVMSRVPGTPWDTVMADMSPEANERAWREVGAIMAGLHRIPSARFGYPANNFELGAGTWVGFLERLFEVSLADADEWGVDVEPDRVRAALDEAKRHVGEVRSPKLVHNDLWPGNVLLDPATGEIHGVVDFERALFGDPLQDFCGAESMATGANTWALTRGYVDAGGEEFWDERLPTATRMSHHDDERLALYRLWAMTVQFIEIVPRGFSGDWVEGHRSQILANRAALFAQFGV